MDIRKAFQKFLDPMPDDTPLSNDPGGALSVVDIIAPSSIEVDFDMLKVNDWHFRTLFVAGYPRFVSANWLEPLISFNHTLDISMYVYPTRSEEILQNLKRKVGEMEATIQSDIKRGHVIEPSVQVALEDALAVQQELAKGAERFFRFALYVTIPAKTIEDLNKTTKQVEATLGSLLIVTKKAVLQGEDAFRTTMPMGRDRLLITRDMDTTSLATTFPFTTSELTANEGILYGINEGNDSLVIFDRFTLENANTVVFGKSGSGKSYSVKLEIMRSMMFDTDVIIIDPENEYESITKMLGGEFINFRFGSGTKINPFDMALLRTNEEESELNQKILSLHGFFRVIMGQLTPTEDAILDRALILTYKQKGITPNPATQGKEPPLVEDLYKTLIGMEDSVSRGLADRIEKFVKGSLVGVFDQQTNIEIKNQLTVFSIRDLEEELRPIAMYLILDFIWTKIRKDVKRRILIVDEAWYMMKFPDSAAFLNSIAKRARKYYLGVSTITQDVEDFLSLDIGKAIIQNSSIQMLHKQSAAAVDKVASVFYLSEGEKHLLLSADVGECLFFAGAAHAAVRVVASPEEHKVATTKPQELESMRIEEANRKEHRQTTVQNITTAPTKQPQQEEDSPIRRAPDIRPAVASGSVTPPTQATTQTTPSPTPAVTVRTPLNTPEKTPSGIASSRFVSSETLTAVPNEPVQPPWATPPQEAAKTNTNRPIFTVETVDSNKPHP